MSSPSSFADALRRRRRASRRRRIGVSVALAATLLIAGLAGYLLLVNDAFKLARVEVSGASLLTDEQIVDAAAAPMGQALVTVDRAPLAARVSDLPAVKQVTVTTVLPDSLHIEVKERTPAYVLQTAEGVQWVDDQGVIFHASTESPTGLLSAEIEQPEVRLLRDLATVISHLPGDVAQRVQVVQARAVDQIVLKLDEGDTVIWGSAEDSELKAEVIAALLQIDAQTYDVSAPRYPTTK